MNWRNGVYFCRLAIARSSLSAPTGGLPAPSIVTRQPSIADEIPGYWSNCATLPAQAAAIDR
jgi:hypothetical protein